MEKWQMGMIFLEVEGEEEGKRNVVGFCFPRSVLPTSGIPHHGP